VTNADKTPAIVDTVEEARALARPPLLIREPLARYLNERGIGSGRLDATSIGEGHSNVTFLVLRDGAEFILRRPPRPPFAATAHDVLREARILSALATTDVRVPRVLLACEDESVLGVPFYVMERVAGDVITATVPTRLDNEDQRRAIAFELIDALVDLHALDPSVSRLPTTNGAEYVSRQLRRFDGLWARHRTRDLPDVDHARRWLEAHAPPPAVPTIVHGDYRLGNVMYAPGPRARLVAILDWEIASVGDPLVDVGWLLSTYPEPGDTSGTLLSMAGAVARGGFPRRAELAARYEERTGRSIRDLGWYTAFAFWRAAVGLESLYRRALNGSTDDPFLETLEHGVPELAERALLATGGTG
jgi:aminoglycoside phosphotransferase (APT) family kinase protein